MHLSSHSARPRLTDVLSRSPRIFLLLLASFSLAMRAARCAVLALLAVLAIAPCVHAVPVTSKLHQVLKNFPRHSPVAPKRQLANCTAYARQDNCVGNPPLRPDALPACGSFAGPLPANTSAFAIIGDFGLDGECMAQVAALTLKVQQQFGHLEFVMTLGDNAYWCAFTAASAM